VPDRLLVNMQLGGDPGRVALVRQPGGEREEQALTPARGEAVQRSQRRGRQRLGQLPVLISARWSAARSGAGRSADRLVIPYDEISEELGYEIDAYSIQREMSTHYGRMVASDDALMLFSDPTEAMEHLRS
jgi:MmoB/DmpM family